MKLCSFSLARALASGFLLSASIGIQGQIPWATEPFSRQNKFEVYGLGQYLHQDNTTMPIRFDANL